jgi:GLPGLI family protein
MQKTFLAFMLSCCSVLAAAQEKSGAISYRQAISMQGQSSGIPENIAALMPKEQVNNKILYYTENASLYENNTQQVNEQDHVIDQGNMHLEFRNDVPDEKIYTDLKNGTRVQQKDLMGRMFLVTDPVAGSKWKFTGRQKIVLSHPCMEAIRTGPGDSVTAWYTSDIPISSGPEGITGLPGMILEATIGKTVTITATEIREDADVLRKIKAPVKGKKMSSEAFRDMAEKKRVEMQQQYGGEGNVIIRTITR